VKDIKYPTNKGMVEVQFDIKNGVKSASKNPILINEKNEILDGAHRFEEAKMSGKDKIKVIKIKQSEFDGMTREDLQNLGVNLEKKSIRSGEEFNVFMEENYYSKTTSQLRTEYQAAKQATGGAKPSSAKEAIAKGLTEEQYVKGQGTQNKDTITLYRGLREKFDKNFDLSKTDAPTGYSTYTDNPNLAREYAGKNGKVYKIELPKNQLGKELLDNNGDRSLFLNNEKKAGLNNVSGNEYLIYNHHDLYNPNSISEFKSSSQLRTEYQAAKGGVKTATLSKPQQL